MGSESDPWVHIPGSLCNTLELEQAVSSLFFSVLIYKRQGIVPASEGYSEINLNRSQGGLVYCLAYSKRSMILAVTVRFPQQHLVQCLAQ